MKSTLYLKTICETVKLHGGKECLVSVSPPKKSGNLMKTGVHLNWPGFVVDQGSAIALREHILVSLSKFKGDTDWNEIIDASVYGSLVRKAKGMGSECHGLTKGQSMKHVMVRASKGVRTW